MKIFSRFILPALSSIVLLSNIATSQTNAEPSNFKINVGYEKEQLLLKCEYGCAWSELSFTLSEYDRIQFVNEMGMTSMEDEQNEQENLAHFLFSFYKTTDKIKCESVFGTSWDEIQFSCSESKCEAQVDNNGVFVKNQ